jgi:hypothetical protein
MLQAAFSGFDYLPDPPSVYVNALLSSDDPDGVYLAQAIKYMEHKGALLGECIDVNKTRSIQYWIIRARKSKLIYGFFPSHKKLLYLIAFNGDESINLRKAILRLKEMTS